MFIKQSVFGCRQSRPAQWQSGKEFGWTALKSWISNAVHPITQFANQFDWEGDDEQGVNQQTNTLDINGWTPIAGCFECFSTTRAYVYSKTADYLNFTHFIIK